MKYSQIALTIFLILNTLIGFSQDSELFWEKDKGFIDENGTTVISCNYDWAGDFDEGLAKVFIGKTDEYGYIEKGKYGYINKEGKEIIPCKYDWIEYYDDDFLKVFTGNTDNDGYPKKGKYGYINKDGKKIIPCKYDDATDFSNGEAMVSLKGRKLFYQPIRRKKRISFSD